MTTLLFKCRVQGLRLFNRELDATKKKEKKSKKTKEKKVEKNFWKEKERK